MTHFAGTYFPRASVTLTTLHLSRQLPRFFIFLSWQIKTETFTKLVPKAILGQLSCIG
jgi:hypothetical protein